MCGRQLFLDKFNLKGFAEVMQNTDILLINWNILNPSLSRAIKQVKWISELNPDIIMLTETKFSKGCIYIKDRLESIDYHVVFPKPKQKEYGVLIATRLKPTMTEFSNNINDELRSRVVSIKLPFTNKELEIIVIYVPNEQGEKKERFLKNLLTTLENTSPEPFRIFGGDFNVLEPNHFPFYSKFEDWEYGFYTSLSNYQLEDAFRHLNPGVQEYSWVGRTGDGYRYDHCFVSNNLLPFIRKCYYIHDPRNLRLSDHSPMLLEIASLAKN
jgi:exodeoxyribonuclease-3